MSVNTCRLMRVKQHRRPNLWHWHPAAVPTQHFLSRPITRIRYLNIFLACRLQQPSVFLRVIRHTVDKTIKTNAKQLCAGHTPRKLPDVSAWRLTDVHRTTPAISRIIAFALPNKKDARLKYQIITLLSTVIFAFFHFSRFMLLFYCNRPESQL